MLRMRMRRKTNEDEKRIQSAFNVGGITIWFLIGLGK